MYQNRRSDWATGSREHAIGFRANERSTAPQDEPLLKVKVTSLRATRPYLSGNSLHDIGHTANGCGELIEIRTTPEGCASVSAAPLSTQQSHPLVLDASARRVQQPEQDDFDERVTSATVSSCEADPLSISMLSTSTFGSLTPHGAAGATSERSQVVRCPATAFLSMSYSLKASIV